jgi:hypothetical protein
MAPFASSTLEQRTLSFLIVSTRSGATVGGIGKPRRRRFAVIVDDVVVVIIIIVIDVRHHYWY